MSTLIQVMAMHNKQEYVRDIIRCPSCGCPHLPKWKKSGLFGIMGKRKPYCGDCGFKGSAEDFIDWTVEEGCLTVVEEVKV